jgi:hypothetical protein
LWDYSCLSLVASRTIDRRNGTKSGNFKKQMVAHVGAWRRVDLFLKNENTNNESIIIMRH